MKKVCIVLNYGNEFPPFVSDFLKELDRKFEKIYFVSKELSKSEEIRYQHKKIDLVRLVPRKNIFYLLWIFLISIDNFAVMLKEKRLSLKSLLDILKLNYAAQLLMDHCKTAIKKNNSDEISVLAIWFWAEALAAAKLKKKYPEIRTVSLAHSFEIDREKNAIYDLGYLTFKHRYIDNIIFISRNMMNEYLKNLKGNISLEKIQVLYLGSNKKYQSNYLLNDKEIVQIVSCSRVVKEKRVYLILEAIKLIKEIRIEWTHFGDGPLMQDLKSKVEDNLPDNLKVNLEGKLSNDKIQKKYAEKGYMLFLNVSTSEGIPVAIMEAMSYGIPVMATDVGGNNEIVSKETGVMLPKDITAEALSKEILNFVRLYKEKNQLKKYEAEKVWREKFDAEKNMRKIVDLLR